MKDIESIFHLAVPAHQHQIAFQHLWLKLEEWDISWQLMTESFHIYLLTYWAELKIIWNRINAIVRPDILTKVCTITRTIFKAYVRMNDVQRSVL